MRESQVEAYFIRRVKEAGGLTRKFVSPNNRGVPDQIAFLPASGVHFVELKAPGEFLRPDQAREHKKLREMGASICVIDSKEAVDYFVESVS